jgi:hypothetical protein
MFGEELLAVRVVDIGVVVEIHDENFVVGIGVFHQRQGRGLHAAAFGPHAAAIVDNQPHGDRDILALEQQDVLLDVVLRYAESVLLEVGDQVSGFVDHRGVAHHQARVGVEDGDGSALRRTGRFGLLAMQTRQAQREHAGGEDEAPRFPGHRCFYYRLNYRRKLVGGAAVPLPPWSGVA